MIVVKTKGYFNHNHVIDGWQGTKPYLDIKGGVTDGIGRVHVDLYGKCEICGKRVWVAKAHLPTKKQDK